MARRGRRAGIAPGARQGMGASSTCGVIPAAHGDACGCATCGVAKGSRNYGTAANRGVMFMGPNDVQVRQRSVRRPRRSCCNLHVV